MEPLDGPVTGRQLHIVEDGFKKKIGAPCNPRKRGRKRRRRERGSSRKGEPHNINDASRKLKLVSGNTTITESILQEEESDSEVTREVAPASGRKKYGRQSSCRREGESRRRSRWKPSRVANAGKSAESRARSNKRSWGTPGREGIAGTYSGKATTLSIQGPAPNSVADPERGKKFPRGLRRLPASEIRASNENVYVDQPTVRWWRSGKAGSTGGTSSDKFLALAHRQEEKNQVSSIARKPRKTSCCRNRGEGGQT